MNTREIWRAGLIVTGIFISLAVCSNFLLHVLLQHGSFDLLDRQLWIWLGALLIAALNVIWFFSIVNNTRYSLLMFVVAALYAVSHQLDILLYPLVGEYKLFKVIPVSFVFLTLLLMMVNTTALASSTIKRHRV
ncbi:MAG TPA: hypothetical protein VNQ79_03275 [Blastocatellia bacterium]|nr:hypothetical protein [Blastocatellia bacterium]